MVIDTHQGVAKESFAVTSVTINPCPHPKFWAFMVPRNLHARLKILLFDVEKTKLIYLFLKLIMQFDLSKKIYEANNLLFFDEGGIISNRRSEAS